MKVNELLNLLVHPLEKIEIPSPVDPPIVDVPPMPEPIEVLPPDGNSLPEPKIFGTPLPYKGLIIAALIVATALSLLYFLVSFLKSKQYQNLKTRAKLAKQNALNQLRQIFSHFIPPLRLDKQEKVALEKKNPSRLYEYLSRGKNLLEKISQNEEKISIGSAIASILLFYQFAEKQQLFSKYPKLSSKHILLLLPFTPLISSQMRNAALKAFSRYLPNLKQIEKLLPERFIPIMDIGKYIAAKLFPHKYKFLYLASFVAGLFASTLLTGPEEKTPKEPEELFPSDNPKITCPGSVSTVGEKSPEVVLYPMVVPVVSLCPESISDKEKEFGPQLLPAERLHVLLHENICHYSPDPNLRKKFQCWDIKNNEEERRKLATTVVNFLATMGTFASILIPSLYLIKTQCWRSQSS